jgi:DNA-binding transcriptional LysR family regulator
MDARALAIFKAVAEAGSISRAADALACGQPNVTARIQRLEDEIGAKLFFRSRRGMTLTSAGMALRAHADRVVSALEEARRAVIEAASNAETLRIGAMETTAAARLGDAMLAFRRHGSGARLSLQTGTTDELVGLVANRRLDAAFVGGRVGRADIVQRPVFVERLALVAERGARAPSDVAGQPLLVFRRGCAYRAAAEQWMRTAGLAPVELVEMGTLDGMLACAAAGAGVALLPQALIERRRDMADNIAVIALEDGFADIETMLIRHVEATASPALDRFMRILGADAGFSSWARP